MTKNKKGGSKHKKYKRVRNNPSNNKVKLNDIVKVFGQEYALITDVLGSCKFKLRCYDNKDRLGCLRGKMRKRQWVKKGDIVLVGLRDFQDCKCDIIHLYKQEEIEILIKISEINHLFIKSDNDNENIEDNCGFIMFDNCDKYINNNTEIDINNI